MRKYILHLALSATLCSAPLLADPCVDLRSAARSNNHQAIPALFANCDIIMSLFIDPWSPLHEAVYWNSLEAASVLIGLGMSVELQDGNGYTPLYVANYKRHHAIAKLLHACGARK